LRFHFEGIGTIAGVSCSLGAIAVVADSLCIHDFGVSARGTGHDAVSVKGEVDAGVTSVVARVAIETTGTNQDAAVAIDGFVVVVPTGRFAGVAVGGIVVAGHTTQLAGVAIVIEGITEVSRTALQDAERSSGVFEVANYRGIGQGHVLAGLAFVEGGAVASETAVSTFGAVIVVGSHSGVIVVVEGTVGSAGIVGHKQEIGEVALEAVGGVDGATQAFYVAGHTNVGDDGIDVLPFRTGWVASCGVEVFVIDCRAWSSLIFAGRAVCVERASAKFAIRMTRRALMIQWNCIVVPVASGTGDNTFGLVEIDDVDSIYVGAGEAIC
jgi:hypothetical protein